jgi:hypothetical protein
MRGLFRSVLSLFGGGGRASPPGPTLAGANAPHQAAFRVPGMS